MYRRYAGHSEARWGQVVLINLGLGGGPRGSFSKGGHCLVHRISKDFIDYDVIPSKFGEGSSHTYIAELPTVQLPPIALWAEPKAQERRSAGGWGLRAGGCLLL